jgi:hypothetical protein
MLKNMLVEIMETPMTLKQQAKAELNFVRWKIFLDHQKFLDTLDMEVINGKLIIKA